MISGAQINKKTTENNIKRYYSVGYLDYSYNNCFRDGYRTRIIFSSIHIYGSFCISFPDFKLAKSELNISISGSVKFLLAITLLVGSVALEPNHSSSKFYDAHTSSGFHSTTQDDNASYSDRKLYATSQIEGTKLPTE